MRQIMRKWAELVGLCGICPIMRKIMRAHNRIIQRSLAKSSSVLSTLSLNLLADIQWPTSMTQRSRWSVVDATWSSAGTTACRPRMRGDTPCLAARSEWSIMYRNRMKYFRCPYIIPQLVGCSNLSSCKCVIRKRTSCTVARVKFTAWLLWNSDRITFHSKNPVMHFICCSSRSIVSLTTCFNWGLATVR